jgi:hypothetical protein
MLPKFGGSYMVWGGCVVFFQCALLLGYLYSHLVVEKIGIMRYRYFHMFLLLLPLLFFPGRQLPVIAAHPNLLMVLDVFWQLSISIGLVFFVLSTTTVITQVWLASSELSQKENPYILYSISNLGSFLGLLSYPFLFEAYFNINTQLNIWRFGYLILLILYFVVFKIVPVSKKQTEAFDLSAKFGVDKLSWILLSAAGVIAFLSVTNVFTYEIAPAPLLWVIALCIYLISFVLNFKHNPFCPGWIRSKFYLVLSSSIVFYFLTQKRILPIFVEIAAYSFFLFAICMFCQSELARMKPKNERELTMFYLLVALGGVVGGFFVSWIAPLFFTLTLEFLVGLFCICFAMGLEEKKGKIGLSNIRLIFYALLLLILWPGFFKNYNFFGVVLIFVFFGLIFKKLKVSLRALSLAVFSIMACSWFISPLWSDFNFIYSKRNYYGIYNLYIKDGAVFLINGTTLHGAQFIGGKDEMEPLTYYHRKSPIGELMESKDFDFNTMGLVGLGVGTLASYGKAGQEIDFFELDPEVFAIASNFFTYLRKTPAKTNVIFGDARVSLKKMPKKRYSIIIVDAFSGDSVPVHLLTTEAMAEYRQHLKDGGLILFHISNRYLNLMPLLFNNAKALNAYVSGKSDRKMYGNVRLPSAWVALTWDADINKKFVSGLKWAKEYVGPDKSCRVWTDTYSNVLTVFKTKVFIDSLKRWQPFYW